MPAVYPTDSRGRTSENIHAFPHLHTVNPLLSASWVMLNLMSHKHVAVWKTLVQPDPCEYKHSAYLLETEISTMETESKTFCLSFTEK